jgi:Tfp pilus assembly protein PilO
MVTIALFAIFAIRPTILTIVELNKEINQKQETLLKLTQKIRDLQNGNNTLQRETQRLPIIDSAVPDNALPEVLVKQIELIANANQLKIMSLSISNTVLIGSEDTANTEQEGKKLPDNARQLPFTISVTGRYEDLYSFTDKLQNLKRPVQVDSFAINSSFIENEKVLILVISGRVPFYSQTKI